MTVQTDQTLEDWAGKDGAAVALGRETSILIYAAVEDAARNMGASSDTEYDALPHAFLAVWRNGLGIEHAARMAVRSLHYTAQAKLNDPNFVSLDAAETSADRDALEVALQSGRDEIARSYGGGSRAEIMSLSEALEIAPKGAAAIVSAVIADGLTAKIPVRNVVTMAADGSTDDDVMALHGGVKDRRTRKGQYRPLKVSVVALAAGVARPRTKSASDDLRTAACTAYGMVQNIRDDSESVASLSASALAWVTRDRRAYGGHGQAVWQRDARPEGIEYAAYRPMSDFQPDIHNWSTIRPLQPVRGYRANTGSKGRKGPMAGQPNESAPYGASGARTPGTLFSATGGPNDAGLTAKRSVRSDAADLAAHEVSDARAQSTPCTRVLPHWSNPYTSKRWGNPIALCGCGPTVGKPLIRQTGIRYVPDRDYRYGVTGEVEHCWTHALTVCPKPVEYRAAESLSVPAMDMSRGDHAAVMQVSKSWVALLDTQSLLYLQRGRMSCGCGRKRGALTVNGEHRAR